MKQVNKLAMLQKHIATGSETSALLLRDELIKNNVDVLPLLISVYESADDDSIRARAIWLAKDLCSPRSWPMVLNALSNPTYSEAVKRAALDSAERLAFAGRLPMGTGDELVKILPQPPDDALLRPWASLMVTLASERSLSALAKTISLRTNVSDALELIAQSPDENVHTTLTILALQHPSRPDIQQSLHYAQQIQRHNEAHILLAQNRSFPDYLVERLTEDMAWSLLLSAAERGALSISARTSLANHAVSATQSTRQRKLLNKLKRSCID